MSWEKKNMLLVFSICLILIVASKWYVSGKYDIMLMCFALEEAFKKKTHMGVMMDNLEKHSLKVK